MHVTDGINSSDPELLEKVKGMHINVGPALLYTNFFEYFFNEEGTKFVQKIKQILPECNIAETLHEDG